MFIILLIGFLGLLAAHLLLVQRVKDLERRLEGVSAPRTVEQSAAASEEIVGTGVSAAGEKGKEARAAAPVKETLAALFERLVGGRLLIWIGGIALAAGGIFLIRHSIELVTPEARMIAAAALGLIMIAGGEYGRSARFFADDPRIGQALVGAGLAILYATTYGSHILFGLIGSGAASALMLVITGAALALSLRHGAPTAALGLVGGVLTPLLVGDRAAGALPVLAYLALLDAAIFAIAWRRGWTWLAAAAVAASFAWSGYFVLEPPRDALPAGVFAALLGIAASLPRPSAGRPLALMQPAIIALVELAVLVARSDLGLPAWLLFGALAAAALPLATLRPHYRLAPVAALLLALLLLMAEAAGGNQVLAAWAAAATTLLLGAGSALLARREGVLRALTACGALAGPLLIIRFLQPELLARPSWGLLALMLGLTGLCLLRLLRTGPQTREMPEIGPLAAGATATLLLAVSAYDLAPRELVSAAWLLLSIALLAAGVRLPDKALRFAGLLLLTGTTLKVFLIDASALDGVLRILSFLGLGIALIGIGKLYSKVLSAGAAPKTQEA